jgi:xanthine dehydrogenase small subunit
MLNGRSIPVDPPVLHVPLLDFIRARGLTGAKEGCAEGECGACAVAVVVPNGAGSEYRLVNSCLLNVAQAIGREIHTVEALAAGGALLDAQRAMAEGGGSQCGYCTPGFVVGLFVEQYRPGRTGPCDPLALAGNLCRCTGYRPIRDAALALGPPPAGALLARLAQPATPLDDVHVEGFSRPRSVEACVRLLTEIPTAVVIAGGTDLGVDANLHGRRWPHLVSVEAIAEMQEFAATPGRVRIGAALPLADLGRAWGDAPDAVSHWLMRFASPPIRTTATLGGNLATASPIGDGAPLLLALDAIVNVASRAGRRAIPVSEFFTGYRQTRLQPGDLLTSIDIPTPLPRLLRFYKVAKRHLDDISTMAAALALDLDAAGTVRRARFAFGGVAATPVRVEDAESVVVGRPWNDDAVARVQQVLDRTLHPISDHRGSAEYRLEVAKSLVARCLWESRA